MNSRLPKVLHQLAGRPMLHHVLQALQALKPNPLVVVYGHGGQALPQAFAEAPVTWALQQEQRGTGHALLQALPHLQPEGTVLVLYGDVPLLQSTTLRQMLSLCQGQHLVLLTQQLEEPTGYGRILRTAQGTVCGIREEKDATAQERAITEINTGIMALPARHLAGWLQALNCANAQQEYYLTDVVSQAVAQGVQVLTVTPEFTWEAMGVNNRAHLAQLERIYQQRQAHQLLEAGVALADPARLDVRGTLHCAQDVHIDVGCVFEGQVTLEEGVQVGAYCVLRDCRVAAHTVLQPYCHLDGVQIGPANRLGPYARLRPGCVTGSGVHVGNFVEVKNTTLGDHTKANHLTYLGDATVGCEVNIGAGTITCNYDGVNKHHTTIGDQVFIGSDTQLVAPVTVEQGATIGAGSTIVSRAPAHQLTVSRAKQVTIPRWQRPTRKKP